MKYMCFVFQSVATKFVNGYAILFRSSLLFLTTQTELREEAISDGFLLERPNVRCRCHQFSFWCCQHNYPHLVDTFEGLEREIV